MTPTAHPTEDIIHVLFIQDDPAVADMYKLKLELDGYQVAVVANDDQVLEAAARTSPIFALGMTRGLLRCNAFAPPPVLATCR